LDKTRRTTCSIGRHRHRSATRRNLVSTPVATAPILSPWPFRATIGRRSPSRSPTTLASSTATSRSITGSCAPRRCGGASSGCCPGDDAIASLTEQAEEFRLDLYLVAYAEGPDPAMARLATGPARGYGEVLYDTTGAFTSTYSPDPSGVTLIAVHADGVVGAI